MNGDPKTDLDQLRKRWDRTCGRPTVQTQSQDDVSICRKYLAVVSLTIQHSGHYMYRPAVAIRTASVTFGSSTFCPHSVSVCFVWISEQTAIISLYNINWLVCITEMECLLRGTDLIFIYSSCYMFHIRTLQNICTIRDPTTADSYNMFCLMVMFSYMFVSPFRPTSGCCTTVLIKYKVTQKNGNFWNA